MAAAPLEFDDADQPGRRVSVEPDPQIAVSPGDRPDTSRLTLRDGTRFHVRGDYREVHAQVQAAAAASHEHGDGTPAGPEGGQT